LQILEDILKDVSEVFNEKIAKIMVLQAVTPCTFVGGYNRFSGNVNISTLKMGAPYSSET
jgi:hypothetical protein